MNKNISLSTIHTFTVVAQKLSFTQAAETLHITPSAVSHQMKHLESQLGVTLFQRKSKGVKLSMAGEALQKYAAQGVKDIQQGIRQCVFANQKHKLVIAAIPSFCQTWLLARIPEFCKQYPHIEIELLALDQIADFSIQHCDAHIHFGSGEYRGLESKFLAHEEVYPVCHPDLIEDAKEADIDTLIQRHKLLHYSAGTEDATGGINWADWLPQHLPQPNAHIEQMWFSHVVMAVNAAKLKQGIALGWHHMVIDDIATGQLCQIGHQSRKTPYSYYLVAPQKAWEDENLGKFYHWLKEKFQD